MKKRILLGVSFLAASFANLSPSFASAFEGEDRGQRQAPAPKEARVSGAKKSKRALDEPRGDGIKRHRTGVIQAPLESSTQGSIRTGASAVVPMVKDNPGLGDLGLLPNEVLANIFTYLEKPTAVRLVSRQAKNIVDEHVPLKVSTSRVSTSRVAEFLAGMPDDPEFSNNKAVALTGWVDLLEALKHKFPPGTIFKGGELYFMDPGNLRHLPEGARATLTLETDAQVHELMTKGVPPHVHIESLEGLWRAFTKTPYFQKLGNVEKQKLTEYENDFSFFLAIKDGENRLRRHLELLFVKTDIYNRYAPVDLPAAVDLHVGWLRALGSKAQRAELFSALNPRITRDFHTQGALNALMHAFANVVPSERAEVADFLTSDMLILAQNAQGNIVENILDDLVTQLVNDGSGRLRSLLTTLDLRKLSRTTIDHTSLYLILKRFARPYPFESEIPLGMAAFLNTNTLRLFAKEAQTGEMRYDQDTFAKVFGKLGHYKTDKVRKQVLGYLQQARLKIPAGAVADKRGAIDISLYDPDTRGYKLLHAVDISALAKETQDPIWPILIMAGLLTLEGEEAALKIAPLLKGGITRILAPLPPMVAGEPSPNSIYVLKDLLLGLSQIPGDEARRQHARVVLPHLFELTDGLTPQEHRASLASSVWQGLLQVQTQSVQDHIYRLLDQSFLDGVTLGGVISHEDVKKTITNLGRIQDQTLREQIMTRIKQSALAPDAQKVTLFEDIDGLASMEDPNSQALAFELFR
ncbi:MAG: hypothetical protein C0514_06125 [Candidatus Puniceispirillum sp.]|nr:hypothetical protein [Candidatus Puniceispirillum sp.]